MGYAAATILVLLSAVAPPQDATKRISFSCRAERAERLVADLSKAAGMRLSVSPKLASEVLVVSVNDVLVKDLMDRIAQVALGDWRPAPDGSTQLLPSPRKRDGAEREARTMLVKQLTKPLEGLSAQAGAGQNDSTTNDIFRLAKLCDLQAVARLPLDQRIVFATTPNLAQRALSGDPDSIIDEIVAAHNREVAAGANALPEPIEVRTGAGPVSFRESGRKRIDGYAKGILAIGRDSIDTFSLLFRLYDAQGKILIEQAEALELPFVSEAEDLKADKPDARGGPSTHETPVELSSDSRELIKLAQEAPHVRRTLSPELLHKLERPLDYDVLSFGATDKVLALAKKRRLPVVALLPDDEAIDTSPDDEEVPTVEAFERHLAEAFTLKEMPNEGWLLIVPAQPSIARACRMDRAALASLIANGHEHGIPSLDEIASYAQTSPCPMLSPAASVYFNLFVPALNAYDWDASTWEALRFFGALEPEQRRELRTGGRLVFSAISGNLKESLNRLTFGADQTLRTDTPNESSNPFIARLQANDRESEDYRTEPTELLSGGLAADGYVEMKQSTAPFLTSVETTAGDFGFPPVVFSLNEVAIRTVSNRRRKSPNPILPSKVRLGKATTYEFAFRFAPGVRIRSSLTDYGFDPNAPVCSSDKLPAEWTDRLAAFVAEFEKTRFGAALARPAPPHPIHP